MNPILQVVLAVAGVAAFSGFLWLWLQWMLEPSDEEVAEMVTQRRAWQEWADAAERRAKNRVDARRRLVRATARPNRGRNRR